MKVTVIIPTFNRARLVREAIDSVLAQTFRDIEVIVIDDGSTDDTEFALRPYGSAIRYVKQENRGLNAARELASRLDAQLREETEGDATGEEDVEHGGPV